MGHGEYQKGPRTGEIIKTRENIAAEHFAKGADGVEARVRQGARKPTAAENEAALRQARLKAKHDKHPKKKS